MATYVFSDVHGHCKTLERLLSRVSPSANDEVWVLGDMIDRGPDPVGVMRLCRSLPNAHVLMGNHEDLMMDFFSNPDGEFAAVNWAINGCATTLSGLRAMDESERVDLVEWVQHLPLSGHVVVGGRPYLLVHAGLVPRSFAARKCWSDASLDALLASQSSEDVLWIREEFWGNPTGLLDQQGNGPIVIAGHTPVPYVEQITDQADRPARDANGKCQMLRVGARPETAGVADRWAIDCGAAGGAGWGRVLMLRLDDQQEFYESVEEGE